MALVEQFKKAGLVLRIEEKPFIPDIDNVVQLDIGRGLKGNNRREYFRLYVPPQGAMIQVRGVDKRTQQLVLLIKEESATFEESVRFLKWRGDTWEQWLDNQKNNRGRASVIKEVHPPEETKRPYIVVETTTDPAARYFLLGVDERQLFIAQLTRPATTVAEARRLLGSSVTFAEGRRKGSKADRQGEWFFLETDQETRAEIETALKKYKTAVHRNANIGEHAGRRGGNPHTASELVKLPTGPALSHGFPVRSRSRVFVRGKVKHTDHRTVKFLHWREVIANNEGATATASALGVNWVD